MENKGLIKISFIGDIMCEKPLLNASKTTDGKYDFSQMFDDTKELFEASDYVVGNLETICAGEEMGLTDHIFNFNIPVELLDAIKESGIDMVSTATNHSLDRGVEGLKKNIKNLRKRDIEYIGTYKTKEERNNTFIKNLHGLKVAFLNYTYGTNTHINGEILGPNEMFHISMLKSQQDEIEKYLIKENPNTIKGKIAKYLFKLITLEQWIKIKKMFGLKYYTAYQDNDLSQIDERYLENIKQDIRKAKEHSDFTVVCMHSGGQFHPEPGNFSKYMMNFMNENGVDLVVGHHPHVVQKSVSFDNGMFGAYSLGNYSISPSSVYILNENLPEFSIMLHVYIDSKTKRVSKKTFSILKIEEINGNLRVYPVDKLFKEAKSSEKRQRILQDSTKIYNLFLNKSDRELEIKSEYIINL